MSKYKIFRIDHFDPVVIGKKRRKLNILFALMSFVFIIAFIVIRQLFEISFGASYLTLMVSIWSFYGFYYFKLKNENQKIATIGDIEFRVDCIIKRIGDSASEFDYGSISVIELQKHIPAISISESKSGFLSYILTIKFRDSHIENFVVSDLPVSKPLNLSIIETLKTLKKVSHITINLK